MPKPSFLIGPFTQILTMQNLPFGGPLQDSHLHIIKDGAIAIAGSRIAAIGPYKDLARQSHKILAPPIPSVATPGLIDAHTHLCFAGTRAHDYAERLAGLTYQEIAKKGGGILDTVRKTRAASQEELEELLIKRCYDLLQRGVTSCEVKSGYGLTVEDELKMLAAIDASVKKQPLSLIPTCLAAHILPPEFSDEKTYLKHILSDLLPKVKERKLASRVDIFIEKGAFSTEASKEYLLKAKKMGFSLTVHADQFSRGGARVAAEVKAISADHLEASTEEDVIALCKAKTVPVILPGATLGLGMPFPNGRLFLDKGLPLVIASDYNPGSAPMGDLLTATALFGMGAKLTMAEQWAALTVRATSALELTDRGILAAGLRADVAIFPCADYREILYHQGSMKPLWMVSEGKVFTINKSSFQID